MRERKMTERNMNPEQNETFFGSPHIPFYHLLFYPFWLRPEAGLDSGRRGWRSRPGVSFGGIAVWGGPRQGGW